MFWAAWLLKPVYLAFFVLKEAISKVFMTFDLSGEKRFLRGFKTFNATNSQKNHKEIIPHKVTIISE